MLHHRTNKKIKIQKTMMNRFLIVLALLLIFVEHSSMAQKEAMKIIEFAQNGAFSVVDKQLNCIIGYNNEYDVSMAEFNYLDVFFLIGHISDPIIISSIDNTTSSDADNCYLGILYAKLVEIYTHGRFIYHKIERIDHKEITIDDLLKIKATYSKWYMDYYSHIQNRNPDIPSALEGSPYRWTDRVYNHQLNFNIHRFTL